MMHQPQPEDPWFIRSCFSDDDLWYKVKELVASPVIESGQHFYANVKFIEETRFDSLTPLEIVNSLPDDYSQYFVFVVDGFSFQQAEFTALVVNFLPDTEDSFDTLPRDRTAKQIETLRAILPTIQAISNNLSLANMDFSDFSAAVDEDGVFRRF